MCTYVNIYYIIKISVYNIYTYIYTHTHRTNSEEFFNRGEDLKYTSDEN